MDANHEVLIRILASADAAWLPVREWSGPMPGAVWKARQSLGKLGLPWLGEATDDAERKRDERALDRLAECGLVAVRRTGPRALRAKTTEAGDARGRAICGLPGVAETLVTLRALSDRLAESGCGPDDWLPEFAMTDVRCYSETTQRAARCELLAVETMLLPALSRGWAESNATIYGHVAYRITVDGRSAMYAEHEMAADVRPDAEARASYEVAVVAALRKLAANGPSDGGREVGMIPLSAGSGVFAMAV